MSSIVHALKQREDFRSLGSVSPDAVSAAEKALGLAFAEDSREYVEAYGTAWFDGHELTGVCPFPRLNVVEVTQDERLYNPDIPHNLYVIEQAHIDGIVIWQSSSGEMYQTSPGSKPLKLCNSLNEYIDL